MKKEIIGKKLGMTQIFAKNGLVIPVTVVEAGPMSVVQKKTADVDGYEALKVAFVDKRENITNKCDAGQFKKANVTPKKYMQEIALDNMDSYELGAKITCDIFDEGDIVDVTGITRGRGFTGAIARWNFQRHRMTHGTGPVHRSSGSMGANSTPSRVFKGKKLAGHYGCETVTIQNLEIVKVDAPRNVLLIKGAIPGPKGSFVTIKTAVKA